MNCPKCGASHTADAAFCSACGTELGSLTCPSCHYSNASSAHFCQACGQKLQATPVPPLRVHPPVEWPREQPTIQHSSWPPVSHPPVEEYVPMEPAHYAGFWARLAAYLIDQVLLLIVFGILGSLLTLLVFKTQADPYFDPFFPAQPLPDNSPVSQTSLALFTGLMEAYSLYAMSRWIYYAVMEASPLQATIGKMLLGIKVTDRFGRRLTFGRAVGRTFAKCVSNLTFYIGYLMAGWTQRKQALHDLMAECLVVRK